jgi:hypothetical protein
MQKLVGGNPMTGDGDPLQLLISLEATPGIEPGYTVLQARQTAFMTVD